MQQARNSPFILWPLLFFTLLALLLSCPAFAGSETWLASPGTGDWNTATNWLGGTVPNSADAVATYKTSSNTAISISANTQVASIVFNPGANSYTFTATPTYALTITGAGIVNNSGITQHFVAPVNGTGGVGRINFINSSTVGSNTNFTVYGGTAASSSGGDIEFRDSSNAGNGAFTLHGSTGGDGGGIVGFSDTASAANSVFTIYGNNSPSLGYGTGFLQFHGAATAANATFTNTTYGGSYITGGVTYFYNNSNGGNSTIINQAGASANSSGGSAVFTDTASAGNATITNYGGSASNIYSGETRFYAGSTAGTATITNNGGTGSSALGSSTKFWEGSTAGNGHFINNGGAVTGSWGGKTEFNDSSTAANGTFTNTGGTAGNTFGGWTEFLDTSAANGIFINHGGTVSSAGGGLVKFHYTATAANGTFTNYAGTVSGANGGAVVFDEAASAGNGNFINYGAAVSGASPGSTQFFSVSGAGNATITNNGGTVSGALGGTTQFRSDSTAANVTVTANGGAVSGALGGTTQFFDWATAGKATLIAHGGTGGGGSILFQHNSTGGTANVKVFGNGNLDISQHTSGVTIGSVEGTGNVFLGAKTLTVGSNNVATTFSGAIQDGGVTAGTNGNLTKIGSGTFTLTGASTYTGATTVNGGTLVADTSVNAAVLSSSSTLAVGGGTFQLKGSSGIQSQALNGLNVNAGASVVEVNNLGASTTLDLGSSVTRAVAGTVDFSARNGAFGADALVKTSQANDITGILGAWATVNGGTAFATKNGANEIVAYTGYTALDARGGGANPAIIDGSTLNYGINAAGTSGNVTMAAGTTTINTLTQDFSTGSTIDTASKTLRVGVIGGIFIAPTKAALTIGTAANSGTLTAGGNVLNGAGELILSNHSSNSLTVNSIVANNGTGAVSLTKSGSGLVVLNGTNTFTGGTTLNAGTLRLGNTAALGPVTGTLRLNGGTLDLATNTSVRAWPTTISSSSTILSNKLAAASAGITHTLGTLAIGTQTLSIGAGSNVAANSNFGVTFGATTLSGDPIFDVANNGTGIGTLTLGRISDGGIRTITKTGPGTLIFGSGGSTTSVTYNTALVVNNGIAQVNLANALGGSFTDASVTVNATTAGSTATFRLNNVSQRIASLTLGGVGGTSTSTNNVATTGTGTLTLEGDVLYDATGNPLGSTISGILGTGGEGRTITVGDSTNADNDLTISANITGSTSSGYPSVIKAGSGTLVLSGTASSFNRGIRIKEGVLSLASLPTASGNSVIGTAGVMFAGGTLSYTGGSVITPRAFAANTGGGRLDITQSGTVLDISGAVTGPDDGSVSDALVKTGPGTLILSGTGNNSNLDVIVDAGLLQLSKTNASVRYAIGRGLVVNSGATAQIATAAVGGDQIEDDADVIVNTGGTFDFNGKNEAFDGLSGGGSLTNTGAADSTMTVGARNNLSGVNTFSGVISDGATNKMSFTKTGLGTQILTGGNSYSGTTTISAGTLQLGNGVADGSVSGNIVNNAKLVYNIAGAKSYGGVISGTGFLVKNGTGTQVLSGPNTYTGATTVNAGKLVINGDNSAATGVVIVNGGGTLGGSGTLGGATTVNSGGILSPGNSPGMLTFDSNLTLSDGSKVIFEGGDLIVVNGTLDLDNWTLSLTDHFQDGGSMTLFSYASLASGANLLPTLDLSSLGFTPTGPVTVTDNGSSIVLNGVSAIPEPSAFVLLGLGVGALALRRRRSGNG